MRLVCATLLCLAWETPAPGAGQASDSQWDFTKYQEAYPDQVCSTRSSQSGRAELQPALEFARAGEPPAADNRELRRRLLATWRDLLGPSARNTGPLELRVLEETRFGSYVRKKVEYTGDPGEPIRAWLFIPTAARPEAPRPAMLCLHQTVRSGKDQCAGVAEPKPELAYGPLLAERGFVTLCPDAICFGERYQVGGDFYCHYGDAVRLYARNAGRSIMSKMVDDAMRAVDFLISMPEVDPARVGCIGHSHGGYGTLFAMTFDERIRAGVVSCGFTSFRSDPLPERWFRRTALIPRLGGFEGRMQDSPVDFHHLFAAISPRPLFLSAALKDSIFPNIGDTAWMEQDAKRVFDREGASSNLVMYAFEGEHAFTPEATRKAWDFLDAHLAQPPATPLKQHSAFYSPETLARIRENLGRHPDGARLAREALSRAKHWIELSDDELWALVFGPSISRSWMVWSNGHCPACTNSVDMYKWQIDARRHPWKVRCPHCRELFPKNDFAAYYRSGLDSHGLFDPARADRNLLVNAEHAAAEDPLRVFGVDDGEGFVAGDKRWRFIGAYLVYGQFKQLILDGVRNLAVAWVLTGDTNCARKAGILLDRLADVYPTFDYGAQAFVYEKKGPTGYISVWHDACEETRELALAYDQVFEGIRHDPQLPSFLSAKSQAHKLDNPKNDFAAVQRNIEERILRDALNSPAKMHSNFPRRETAYTIIKCVLGWPENRAEVETFVEEFARTATAVDGVTGEKGLSGYSSYTIGGLAGLLAELARTDPQFLPRLLERVPSLRQTWRFHIDTFCLDRFYPNSGDCGSFAQPVGRYVGANFAKLDQPRLEPSIFSFFWQLHEATGDAAYVQVLHRENGDSTEGLPHDLFTSDAATFRTNVMEVLARHGPRPRLGSVLKPNWHLAVLRSGEGKAARAVWLDFDAGGGHGHQDGMTLGLFACGRDLLPDFGYPPVQHGGWTTPQVAWYLSPAAHNTAVVDGRPQTAAAGQVTLWADGAGFHLVRASAPKVAAADQFERTVALVDGPDDAFYVLDIFRVAGGTNHAKFVHGPKAKMEVSGLTLSTAPDYGHGSLMRNFEADPAARPGWSAAWHLENESSAGEPATFRYTDLSLECQASTAEAQVMPYSGPTPDGFWNPALMLRRQGPAPLHSTFVALLQGANQGHPVATSRRLETRHEGQSCTNGCVALAIAASAHCEDVFLAAAPAHANLPITAPAGRISGFTGEFGWIRHKDGSPERLAVGRASGLSVKDLVLECDSGAELLEITIQGNVALLVSGHTNEVRSLRTGNQPVRLSVPHSAKPL